MSLSSKYCSSIFFAALALVFSATIGGAAPVEAKLSLNQAIAAALTQNADLRSARFLAEQAQADIERARAEFSPKVEGKAGVGPTTRVSGNALRSESNSKDWGAAFIGTLELTQPIFTFGRRADYLNAARHGKLASKEEERTQAIRLRFEVKEAFWGAQYAATLLDFIEGGRKDLEKAEAAMAKKLSKEDRFRLEIFRAQVEAKEAEVRKGLALAKAALRLRTGAEQSVAPDEDWLEEGERKRAEIGTYVSHALRERPELRRLDAGIIAKRSFASGERKAAYPVLGILARYEFAQANKREEQQSIYAHDPFNRDTIMVGLGAIWTFQWGLAEAKAARSESEAMELEAKLTYARQGIPVAVERAYLELEEAEIKLAAADRANRSAKRWLSGSMMGLGTGLGAVDARKLVDAYQARAGAAKDYFEAVYRHHMAWAALSEAVGAEVDPLLLAATSAPDSKKNK